MGQEREFERVKLFCGLIFGDDTLYEKVKTRLSQAFSDLDRESSRFPFDVTTYYNDEMGYPLYRRFVSFNDLVSPMCLADCKSFTNRLEGEYAVAGGRRINIDPGVISRANVIMATTKNHYHRVPLSGGIYAHLEYVLRDRVLQTLPWTYPDFRTSPYMAFFENLRQDLRRQLREA